MRFAAWLVLFATLLLWSGNWIVARAAREEIGPALATVGRLILVLAILLPFTFSGLTGKLPQLRRRDWIVLASLGLAGGGPHLALQWLGLHYTTATSGILYLSVTPIFILLLAAPLGERIRLAQWAGVLISFSGVALIAAQGKVHLVSFNIGDLMALASMLMWAGYTVLLRVRRDPLDIAELLTMVCGFGLVYMLPWLAWETTAYEMRLTAQGTLAVLYSGIGSLLLAYGGGSVVGMRLWGSRARGTRVLIPWSGVSLSVALLSVLRMMYHFAGIGLILTGTWVASTR